MPNAICAGSSSNGARQRQPATSPSKVVPMKEPSWWTDDRVTELRARHANGESGSQIGIAMHAKSRNAVVGKLYRLGLRRQVQIGAKSELKLKPRTKRNTVHHIDGRIFFRG